MKSTLRAAKVDESDLLLEIRSPITFSDAAAPVCFAKAQVQSQVEESAAVTTLARATLASAIASRPPPPSRSCTVCPVAFEIASAKVVPARFAIVCRSAGRLFGARSGSVDASVVGDCGRASTSAPARDAKAARGWRSGDCERRCFLPGREAFVGESGGRRIRAMSSARSAASYSASRARSSFSASIWPRSSCCKRLRTDSNAAELPAARVEGTSAAFRFSTDTSHTSTAASSVLLESGAEARPKERNGERDVAVGGKQCWM